MGYVDARTGTPWNRLLIAIEYSLLEGVRNTGTSHFGRLESFVGRVRSELGVMLEGGVTMYEGVIPAAVGLLDHRTTGARQLGALVLKQHGLEYAGLFTDDDPAKMPAVAAATPLLVRRVQNDPDPAVRGAALEALYYLCTYDFTAIEPYLQNLAVGIRDEAPAVRCAYLDILVCMLTDGMDTKGEAQQRRPPGDDAIRAAVLEIGPLLQDHSLPVQRAAVYVLWLLCIYSPQEGSKHLAQIQALVAHENDTVSRRAGMVLLYATTVSPDAVAPAREDLESVLSDSSRGVGCRIAAGATLASLATVDGNAPRRLEITDELAGLTEVGAGSDDDDILDQAFELAAIRPSIAGAVLPALEPSLSSYVEAVRESSDDEAFDSDAGEKIGRISEIISTVCDSPDSDVDDEVLVRFRELLREVLVMGVTEIEPEITSALDVLPPE